MSPQMYDACFVFTNPRHHLAMMAPVARELRRRGLSVQLISLAELRGFSSPREIDLPMRVALPVNLRRSPKVGAGLGAQTGSARSLARRLVTAILVPLLRRWVGQSRAVVVPNDAAFPFAELIAGLRGAPIVLLQEGIRFPMPNGDAYGTGPVAKICAWGEGSREYFTSRGVPIDRIAVTGSPRHDDLDPRRWASEGADVLARLRLTERPVALMTNPIEHQGYGTASDKFRAFEQFVTEAAPLLRQRGRKLIVKNHAFEAPEDYAAAAARTRTSDVVIVDPASSLFGALAASAAALVFTSTAGLEALLFDLPLGALPLPRAAYGFEYVEQGVAVPLPAGAVAPALAELLEPSHARASAATRFVARHLHDRGRATLNVADVINAIVETSSLHHGSRPRSRAAPRTA